MNTRRLATLASIATLCLATACAPMRRADRDDDRMRPVPVAGYNQYAQYGVVRNIEVIPVASRSSGAGAVLGAVIGAVIGNQIGSGGGRALATGAGAVGGAIVGNTVEQRRQRRDDEVFRVSVRFDDGGVREFDFHHIDDLRPGDRVKFEGGQLHRI